MFSDKQRESVPFKGDYIDLLNETEGSNISQRGCTILQGVQNMAAILTIFCTPTHFWGVHYLALHQILTVECKKCQLNMAFNEA